MKIWNSHLSNHSTYFTATGTFKTSQQAVTVANWIKKVFDAFGMEPEDLGIKTRDNKVIVRYYAMGPNHELEDFLLDEGAEVKTEME